MKPGELRDQLEANLYTHTSIMHTDTNPPDRIKVLGEIRLDPKVVEKYNFNFGLSSLIHLSVIFTRNASQKCKTH